MLIKGYDAIALLKGAARETISDRVPSLAAETAYYFFFSLFPLLLFLTPLMGLFGDRGETMRWIEGQLATAVGPQAFVPIRAMLQEVVYTKNAPGLMSLGALLAAWAGSHIFGSLMAALNVAYDVTETRPWWKQQAIRLGVFAASAVIVLLASVVLLGGGAVAGWVTGHLGLGESGRTLWAMLQTPVAVAFMVGLAFIVYKALPNVKQRNWMVLVAAILATGLWAIATFLFRLYVAQFGHFSATYGTIGGIIALLTWMYYTMLVILFGGELAAELHHGTGATRPVRGAVYHGRIVAAEGPDLGSVERGDRLR